MSQPGDVGPLDAPLEHGNMEGASDIPDKNEPEAIISAIAAKRGIRPGAGGLDYITVGDVTIGLRKPGGANYMRALELAGSSASIMPMMEAVLSIATINGMPIPAITTRARIDQICDEIGRDAIDQLLNWYQRKMYPEITEILEAYPGIDPASPEFANKVAAARAAKLKK